MTVRRVTETLVQVRHHQLNSQESGTTVTYEAAPGRVEACVAAIDALVYEAYGYRGRKAGAR